MSCSKLLPPFTYDVLRYLNRDQLEQFSIVCCPLKNLIDRYFQSKPYRIFDELEIRRGSYALRHNKVSWHPNRQDYNVQQFLAGQKCSIDQTKCWVDHAYYPFVEMHPYLGPPVRIKETTICIARNSTYNLEQMESIAYVWREGNIYIEDIRNYDMRIMNPKYQDVQSILNSPTILQCQILYMNNLYFSFKDYNVLYTVKVIETRCCDRNQIALWLQYWQQFLEKPGVKPVISFPKLRHENIDNLLNQLSKAFTSAVLPNAFKIVFVLPDEELTVFQKTNNTSREKLELKKGLPAEYQMCCPGLEKYDNYTLERYSI